MTAPLDPERVRLALGHVARYRLTTPEAVRTLAALRLRTNATAVAFLRALVGDGRLGEAPLDRHGRYFYLTERGAREVIAGTLDGHSGPLSEPAKARAFALLAFCRLSGADRERLSPDDLRRAVPALDTGGMPTTFYATRSESARTLGFARPDTGGFGRWDRVLAKLADDVRRLSADPGLQPLIASRAFEVTLITATPEKADRLRTAFSETARASIPVHVVAVPRLIALTGSIRAPPST